MKAAGGFYAQLASVGFAVMAGACTTTYQNGGPPTVMVDTPLGGPQVIAGGTPAVPPGGNLAAPPPSLNPASPPSMPKGGRDGVYSGTAVPLDTAGGLCIQNQQVSDFRVRGSDVRWGGFQGSIMPDNGVQMLYGTASVTGRFAGDTFTGQFDVPGRFGPGCSYMMTLHKTAS